MSRSIMVDTFWISVVQHLVKVLYLRLLAA